MGRHKGRRGAWGPGALRKRTSELYWKQPLKWNRQAEKTGTRIKVFCHSLADVFDHEAPPGAREDLWKLIAATPNLDWQLLTKRPQNFNFLPWAADGVPWKNVWLGVSAENVKEAERRIPLLRAWNATVKFVSAEPLLEDISAVDFSGIDWIIIGGESGSNARPMKTEWVRSLIASAEKAGGQIWVKQMGEIWARENRTRLLQTTDANGLFQIEISKSKHGADPRGWDADLRIQNDPVLEEAPQAPVLSSDPPRPEKISKERSTNMRTEDNCAECNEFGPMVDHKCFRCYRRARRAVGLDRHSGAGGEKKVVKEQLKTYTTLLGVFKTANVSKPDEALILAVMDRYLPLVRDVFPGAAVEDEIAQSIEAAEEAPVRKEATFEGFVQKKTGRSERVNRAH